MGHKRNTAPNGVRQMVVSRDTSLSNLEHPASTEFSLNSPHNEDVSDKVWRILVVDDTKLARDMIASILEDYFTLIFAKDGIEAIEKARKCSPDLILLDIEMPRLDGYQTCASLKSDEITNRIPVLFITSRTTTYDEMKGFEVGCVDYITKPFAPPVVLARVRAQIALVDQSVLLDRLSIAGEYKDSETGAHVKRIGHYSEILARGLGWTTATCQAIARTAPMHDIGKIAIPDKIILKPGPLTDDERAIMKSHCEVGAKILDSKGGALMRLAASIALSHHERWDGTGYPHMLSGHDIPIEGRIVSIADVFDALLTSRSYKEAWPLDLVVKYIVNNAGTQFDPEIVSLFEHSLDDFVKVRLAHSG